MIVEDSANDATLLLAELNRKGQSPTHQRVETKADFLAALQTQSWDAVIADYVLPQFSGPEALRLLRQQGLDIPFIMVSGIYGEEEAVRMMKAGANDYVMKANLSRLSPALERELLAAQDRHRRKRAEGAMQFLAAIIESSMDAIYGKSLEGVIVSWNPAAELLFGYSAEEIIGRSYAVLFPEHRRSEMMDIQAGVRRGDIFGEMETERLHKSGKIIPVTVTVSPVKSTSGEIIGASSITRDISRQKQADYERQQLIQSLMAAAKRVQTLTGLLPICSSCKRIRDDKGYWQQVEAYITEHSSITFSHSICPTCAEEYERKFEIKNK
ncbi:MAG TPA: PAS domain S-box protein [Verrucomicrobiae bacterium]|nr:PAS domain S-box protein [Verrucomicrobiae bacterium]